MTVLVGILCEGGVVVGADSSATFASGAAPTIEQPTKKLTIIDNQMIVATTGPIGFGQRFVGVIEKLHRDGKLKRPPLDIGKAICQAAINDLGSTLPPLPQLVANRQLDFGGLVASVYKKKPYLIEFDSGTLQPELKDDRLWYVSMGSGQRIADPFLGMMRRSFFESGPPDLPTGRFAVSWVLEHTCDLNPGGVKEPFNMAILDSSSSTAKQLSDEEVQEHKEMIKQAYSHIAKLRTEIFTTEAPEIPD